MSNEQYIGVDPIYQNHAFDTEAPLSSGTKAEEVAVAWEESLPVKTVDLAVDQSPVSTLSEGADDVGPAITVNEDGTVTNNSPALLVDAGLTVSDEKLEGDEDGDGVVSVEEARKADLRAKLEELGLPVSGTNEEMAERLADAGVTEVPVAGE